MSENLNLFDIDNLMGGTASSDLYKDKLPKFEDDFNSPLIRGLDDYFTKIITGSSNITKDQRFVLQKFFEKLKYIQETIDPNKLKPFSYYYNEDDDLILHRSSVDCFINLVIHPEEDFSLSIIGKEKGNSIEYFENKEADYEMIALSFLK